MAFRRLWFVVLWLVAPTALAQQANELTLFSSPGLSGARFTVTGPRAHLDLPYIARSSLASDGAHWEYCPAPNYGGACVVLAGAQRELRLPFGAVRSVRPLPVAPPPPPPPEQAREMTFFSATGFAGARFTVTGPRTILDLPFRPGSVALTGGGAWQVCAQERYAGRCEIIGASRRAYAFGPGTIRSVQPVSETAPHEGAWRELARLNVRDRADHDTAPVADRELYREVKVCAERNAIRIRRAEVQRGNGRWQRLFLPLAISPGTCSEPVALMSAPQRVRAFRFDYEAWSPGIARGTVLVMGLPAVVGTPRQ